MPVYFNIINIIVIYRLECETGLNSEKPQNHKRKEKIIKGDAWNVIFSSFHTLFWRIAIARVKYDAK